MHLFVCGFKVLLVSLIFSSSCFARNMTGGYEYYQVGSSIGKPNIGILAVILTEEGQSRDVRTVFKLGGNVTTSSGDTVIWGYFYANPFDVSWGNPDNPDLYIKIWIDHTGMIYANYFHVSVPSIRVVTGVTDGNHIMTHDNVFSEATMSNRYVQHRRYPSGFFEVVQQ